MNCTWEDCKEEAIVAKIKDEIEWANLCGKHNLQLEFDIVSKNMGKLMESYIKAQGGVEKLKEYLDET